jgi:hypothetical protein
LLHLIFINRLNLTFISKTGFQKKSKALKNVLVGSAGILPAMARERHKIADHRQFFDCFGNPAGKMLRSRL